VRVVNLADAAFLLQRKDRLPHDSSCGSELNKKKAELPLGQVQQGGMKHKKIIMLQKIIYQIDRHFTIKTTLQTQQCRYAVLAWLNS
jgi:hypothetical protein